MSRIIDISPPISARLAVWPGDVGYERTVNLAIDRGSNIDLSSIRTTVHLGAHADAPSHYLAGGQGIAERPLERYYGDCQVIEVRIPRGERIRPQHLGGPLLAPRVLFRTGSYPDPTDFTTDFNSLSPELIEQIAAQGGVLVGIDTPSIDPFSSEELESHQAVARYDLAVLEGLVLGAVPPGCYTLLALPLKLEGADASPVRAALIAGD